ncbi:MAG TPA: NAD(P)-dependent alcohol dehydrogenase, partial [Flavipsychrobacter sp.]
AGLQPGRKVLVNGASGSLGVAAVQIAKYMGAEVTAVCSSANVELVRSLGADHVIDYKTTDFTEAGRLYDVIYDTVGKSSFAACKKILTGTGVYMSPVLGLKLLRQMMMNPLRGGKKAKFDATGLKPAMAIRNMLRELEGMMANGKYNPVIERRYKMEEVVDAHRYIDTGHKRGNIVLSIAQG